MAKRIGSGMVLVNGAGEVLLVKPAYKDGWEVPGGLVEDQESPRAAAEREIGEELGLVRAAGVLLVVDWAGPQPALSDGLMFLFDGGVLDGSDAAGIRLPPAELDAFEFVNRERLVEYLPAHMARRVAAALVARDRGETTDLEDGVVPRGR